MRTRDSKLKFVQFVTPHQTLEIPVETVSNPADIAQGLMNEPWLADDTGMLFEFGKETNQSFWMKDTELPLSIAFFDARGVIVDIKDLTPFSTDAVNSSAAYTGAIEVHRGWFDKHNIKVNDRIIISDKLHPLRSGEHFMYEGDVAKATHEGIEKQGVFHEIEEDESSSLPWSEVDLDRAQMKFPRVLRSSSSINLPKRNFQGFKSVSFVKRSQSSPTPIHIQELVHPDTGRRLDDPDEFWSVINGKHEEQGLNQNKYRDSISRMFDSMLQRTIGRRGSELGRLGLERAAYAMDLEPQAIKMLSHKKGWGYHPDKVSYATAALSPKTSMYSGGAGPHNSTLDNTITALDMIHKLSREEGFNLSQSHIDMINERREKVAKEVRAAGVIDKSRDTLTDAKRRLLEEHEALQQAPTQPGNYQLHELSDHAVAAMIGGRTKPSDKFKAVQLLTSDKRRDDDKHLASNPHAQQARQMDRLAIYTKVNGNTIESGFGVAPKVMSFGSNARDPERSPHSTVDERGMSPLPLPNITGANGFGSGDQDINVKILTDPDLQEEYSKRATSLHMMSDRAGRRSNEELRREREEGAGRYASGAGYQWYDSAWLGARDQVTGSHTPATESVEIEGIRMSPTRFQNTPWPIPIIDPAGFVSPAYAASHKDDDARKKYELERLATPLDTYYRPSSYTEHDKQEPTAESKVSCQHTHEHLADLNEIMKHLDTQRRLGVSSADIANVLQLPNLRTDNKSDRVVIDIKGDGAAKPSKRKPSKPKATPTDVAVTKDKTPKKAPTKKAPTKKTKPTNEEKSKSAPVKKKAPTQPTKKSPKQKVEPSTLVEDTKAPAKKTPTKKTTPKPKTKRTPSQKKKKQPSTKTSPKPVDDLDFDFEIPKFNFDWDI